jgi:hypothetical protein
VVKRYHKAAQNLDSYKPRNDRGDHADPNTREDGPAINLVVSDHSGHDCRQHEHAFQAFAKNEDCNIELRRKLAGVFSRGIGAASRRYSLPKKHSRDEKGADREKNRKNPASDAHNALISLLETTLR